MTTTTPELRAALADPRTESEIALDTAIDRVMGDRLTPEQVEELRAMVEHPDPNEN